MLFGLHLSVHGFDRVYSGFPDTSLPAVFPRAPFQENTCYAADTFAVYHSDMGIQATESIREAACTSLSIDLKKFDGMHCTMGATDADDILATTLGELLSVA